MKKLFVLDLDKPSEVVSSGFVRYFVLFGAVLFATFGVLILFNTVGWVDMNSAAILWAFAPVALFVLGGAAFATAAAAVPLFIAFRLPAPKPLSEQNMLFASGRWVVRVFLGTALLVAGGIIGGFIAQSLDFVAQLASRAPAPREGDPTLTPEAGAVLMAFFDMVLLWLGLALTIGLLAAGLAVIVLSVRLLRAGREARFEALAPRGALTTTDPKKLARRLTWRHHFAHWGYEAYLFGFLYFFGGVIAALVLLPLTFARQGIADWIQSLAG